MKKLIAATAGLTLLYTSLAMAQNSTRNAPPPSVQREQQGGVQPRPGLDTPIIHRQPRPGDLPSEARADDPGTINAQDKELDRMIRGICRGC
jgi:hypothetical protein